VFWKLQPIQRQDRDVHRGQQRRVLPFGQHVLAIGAGHVAGHRVTAAGRVKRDEHRAREGAPAQQKGELGHIVGQHANMERRAGLASRP
jgi:hypothetical protein